MHITDLSLDDMTVEELKDIKVENLIDLDNIKIQIDFAEDSPETLDKTWLFNAKIAMKKVGRNDQLIANALSRRTKEEAKIRKDTFEGLFVRAASFMLDRDVFVEIKDKANRFMEDQ